MNAAKYLTYPQNEIVCRCAAFPWPHAEWLSRRCWVEAGEQETFPTLHRTDFDDAFLDDPRRDLL